MKSENFLTQEVRKRGFLFDMAIFGTGIIANFVPQASEAVYGYPRWFGGLMIMAFIAHAYGAYLKRWPLQRRLSARSVSPPKDKDEKPIFSPALAKFEGRILVLLIIHWMFWGLMLSFGMQNLFPWLQKFSEPMEVFGDSLGLVMMLIFIALARHSYLVCWQSALLAKSEASREFLEITTPN